MKTMLSTLGAITILFSIGVALYFVYFKTSKSNKKFNFGFPTIFKCPHKQSEENPTYMPPLFSFVVGSTGQAFEVKSIPPRGLTIGRASPSDIIISTKGNNCFSAEHFIICKDENGFFLNVIPSAHLKNGIRTEPDLTSPKINTSIDITHRLKLYIGTDTITFFLPDHDNCNNNQSQTIVNNRCSRR